jgi:hypothetical protein
MEPARELGKLLLICGAVLAVFGAALVLGARPGGLPLRLGRLPGDIAYQGRRGTIYFPIVTCLALSAALTLIVWLVQRFRR